ncbi:glycosyltransferase [Paucibacter sp. TC2R-5]|uniref:glycosyltransferase n=1 Tax=Paucibacter sp. TC2R-5 TaxID=2893555 RepID=UPI0021E3ABE2|nr:glycosyltransferase [Paucibacter sp. TC2R-5]MCV2361773.1 glycosyltransferase [Paucibacter sp. TC2R-5]
MRILIDLQGCQNGSKNRGIGRYSLSLTKALLKHSGEHEFYVLLNEMFVEEARSLRQVLGELLPPERIIGFEAIGPVDELRPENAWRRKAACVLREALIADLAPDALLISSMVEGAMDATVTSIGWIPGPTVVASVLYDLIPLHDPERYIGWEPGARWYYDKMDSLRRADCLLAISESAAAEAVELLGVPPSCVTTISTAADEIFVDAQVSAFVMTACREKFALTHPYLMHSGNIEPRKNFEGLIQAFSALPLSLRKQYQLVLAGKVSPADLEKLQGLAEILGLKQGCLVVTGHVSDEELMALYAGCHLFVFPSLHEGFGLPALEAMHFGVPTIGSNTTSIPEVIGRADATFDPHSVAAITAAIQRCLSDSAFYASLKAHALEQSKRFSWDDCATRTLRALELTAAKRAAEPLAGLDSNARRALILNALISPERDTAPSEQELRGVAHCLASNLDTVARLTASANWGGKLSWRVEGPFDSTYSLALLNRETARALEALGHTVALHSTEGPGDFPANPHFLAANQDLATMHARLDSMPQSATHVTSRNLYPPRVSDMGSPLNLLHHYAWEESGFPAEWVQNFNQHLQGLTCLSEHVQKVLIDNGVSVPMVTSGCGVDHWERVVATSNVSFPGKRFRVLHVSSCFPRKGADALLKAFGAVFSQADDVSLIIKTFANPHNDIHQQLAACRAANPQYPDVHVIEGDLSDNDLKALYQQCHVLAAPSRAEGFGLPMAEAMLSGLPVITTAWSGQLDFCSEENSWLVDYTFTPAQTHFNVHGSVWAEPDHDSLCDALRRARATSPAERSRRAQHGRDVLLRHFKWTDVTARAVNATRQWAQGQAGLGQPRTGWVTTWNTKCGIASYARHILEASDQAVTILAPIQDGRVRTDEDFVHRCWASEKQNNRFELLDAAITEHDLNTLVVQFNYGFFNLEQFAGFLHRQVDAGRTVIVMMHSTGDPVALAEWDINWRLVTAADALRRCARVLVHAISDLNRLKRLGLVQNVALFPHPMRHMGKQLPVASTTEPRADTATALIATFGYCLPHKGLPEVLEAVELLHKRGLPVRLRMLNAEYPDPVSAQLVAQLRKRVVDSNLQDFVEVRSEYLTDDQAAALMAEADLLVFAYQNTDESSSAAVRDGLATARPVAVTPIQIFDNLGDAVHRFPGRSPEDIALGINAALKTANAPQMIQHAKRWRDAHEVDPLAARLVAMQQALLRPGTPRHYRLDGSSRLLRSAVGSARGNQLHSTCKEGYLLFGPYLQLPAGHYVAELDWSYEVLSTSDCHIEVAANHGAELLARKTVKPGRVDGSVRTKIPFVLTWPCGDLELRLHIASDTKAIINHLTVKPVGAVAEVVPTGKTH